MKVDNVKVVRLMVEARKVDTWTTLAWREEKSKLPVLMVDAVITLIPIVLPVMLLALHDDTAKLDR
jgi:hypothetical protein